MGLSDAISFSTQAWEHLQQGFLPPRGINKFGYNTAVGKPEETIFGRGGLRTYETGAWSAQITSTDPGDTQVYRVQGLDNNYDWKITNVTATGTTPANIPGTWWDIFRIENLGAKNTGQINVFKANDAGNPKCRILAGVSQSTCAAMMIPRNHNGYLRYYSFSSAVRHMQGLVYKRPFGGDFRIQAQETFSDGGDKSQTYDIMPVYEAKSVIELRAHVTEGNERGVIEGKFGIILVAQ